MRMAQVDNTTIMTQLLRTIVDIIGRRSSEHYAVVMINNSLQHLSQEYPVLTQVTIRSSQFTESSQLITVPDVINKISDKDLQIIIEKFLLEITNSIGKTAGHFFIKELKDTVGANFEVALEGLGIDLSYMHFQQLVEKRPKPLQLSDSATVLRRVLHALVDLLTKETS